MSVTLEFIETDGNWTIGQHYAGELTAGGFVDIYDDDPGDEDAWSADSRQEYNRENEDFETFWFLPGVEGVLFREIKSE